MAVPASKDELLSAIRTSFDRLDQDLDRVPPQMARDTVLPGHAKDTLMSPADLVAYLIGWNEQVLIWHERRRNGLEDEFPAEGVTWNELGKLARRYYADRADASWEDLRRRLVDVKERIVALIEGSSDEELYGAAWYGKWTLGRMISFNTSSPYANARKRIRAWLRG
ncbi:ClbS/DfsB family four-helix bundle protein [Leucobacter weissii]|uniref:ClbS/DfsB family four-helix bundle protein n=1 Tax=Leucobacter weissii TaxID=1983706 RepID=A0A939SAW9_9MICO|nr:ClbS/DfsB family four-helix bundle protein [Leucobacter weissii]MBO1900895.1 ClbS/DfsB family four-helix bundle protein [Leucobacter weissii]